MQVQAAYALALNARCAIAMAKVLDHINEGAALDREESAWRTAYEVGHATDSAMPMLFDDSRICRFGWEAGRQARVATLALAATA